MPLHKKSNSHKLKNNMIARLTYNIECPIEGVSKEEFVRWIEFALGVPGACIEEAHPLYHHNVVELDDYEELEVCDE